MVRWRRSVFPPNPRNIRSFALQLQAPENLVLREYDGGRVDSQLILDSDHEEHLALWDQSFIDTEIGRAEKIFVDCTFKATPSLEGAYQFLTIMAVKHDHVSRVSILILNYIVNIFFLQAIPFFWAIMSRKTESAYTAIMRFVRGIVDTGSWTVVMCDFELALRNAIRALVPHARIAGCQFHFDQVKKKCLHFFDCSNYL